MSRNTAKPQVAIVMGSDSDWPVLKSGAEILSGFGVQFEVRVLSAHRTPDEASSYAKNAQKRGIRVIIAAAGGAAHLGGVLAAHTTLPVLGVPVKGGALNGIDALLAMVQMPAGIPVPTLTLGSAGPVNAALFAVQILALGNPVLAAKMKKHKQTLKNKVKQGDSRIQKELGA